MKKILLFSVVLLTYTLGNAQNGTQTSKNTSSSSPAKLNERNVVKEQSTLKSGENKVSPENKKYEALKGEPVRLDQGRFDNNRQLKTETKKK